MSKIKNDLRSSVAFTCVSESTPTRKCKSSPGEHCCTFDATAPNKFIYIDPERPLEDTPTGTDAAFSCNAETCSCCQHSHSTAEEPPTAEEQDGDPCGSNNCESTPEGIFCAFSSTFRPKTINCRRNLLFWFFTCLPASRPRSAFIFFIITCCWRWRCILRIRRRLRRRCNYRFRS